MMRRLALPGHPGVPGSAGSVGICQHGRSRGVRAGLRPSRRSGAPGAAPPQKGTTETQDAGKAAPEVLPLEKAEKREPLARTSFRRKKAERGRGGGGAVGAGSEALGLGSEEPFFVHMLAPRARPIVLVDGYNVCFEWARLAKVAQRGDLEEARSRLLDACTPYGSAHGVKLTVVFDAHISGSALPPTAHILGVDVVFSRRTIADFWIEDKVAEIVKEGGNGQASASHVVVVTGDHGLQTAVLARGGYVKSTSMFIQELKELMKEKVDTCLSENMFQQTSLADGLAQSTVQGLLQMRKQLAPQDPYYEKFIVPYDRLSSPRAELAGASTGTQAQRVRQASAPSLASSEGRAPAGGSAGAASPSAPAVEAPVADGASDRGQNGALAKAREVEEHSSNLGHSLSSYSGGSSSSRGNTSKKKSARVSDSSSGRQREPVQQSSGHGHGQLVAKRGGEAEPWEKGRVEAKPGAVGPFGVLQALLQEEPKGAQKGPLEEALPASLPRNGREAPFLTGKAANRIAEVPPVGQRNTSTRPGQRSSEPGPRPQVQRAPPQPLPSQAKDKGGQLAVRGGSQAELRTTGRGATEGSAGDDGFRVRIVGSTRGEGEGRGLPALRMGEGGAPCEECLAQLRGAHVAGTQEYAEALMSAMCFCSRPPEHAFSSKVVKKSRQKKAGLAPVVGSLGGPEDMMALLRSKKSLEW